jgi:hypothetical protein
MQKAVRRGSADLASKAATVLAARGDSAWVRTRTTVIAFEECWPLASRLDSRSPPLEVLREIAMSIKNKDAAGLGSLAHAAAEGDRSAIDMALDPVAVKIVAAALRRPEDFFVWAIRHSPDSHSLRIVLSAQRFFGLATWPWDKAFMAAGAFLSCQESVPIPPSTPIESFDEFPYWAAIDKHTPQGKSVLRRVGARLRVPFEHLQWASFYFESAKTNALAPCPWWLAEKRWRFASQGMDCLTASEMWQQAAPLVESSVQFACQQLLQALEVGDNAALL